MYDLKKIVSVLFVSVSVLFVLNVSIYFKKKLENFPNNNCVVCGHYHYISSEYLVDFKENINLPYANIETVYFPLCKKCYTNLDKINFNFLFLCLVLSNYDKNDALLIVNRLIKIKIKKNSNTVFA